MPKGEQNTQVNNNPSIRSIVLNLDKERYFAFNGTLYQQIFPVDFTTAMHFTRVYECENEALRQNTNPLQNVTSIILCPQHLPVKYSCEFARNYITEQLTRIQEIGIRYKLQDLSMTFVINRLSDSKGNAQEEEHVTDLQMHYNKLNQLLVKENRVNMFIKYKVSIKTSTNHKLETFLTFAIINFIGEQYKLQFTTSMNRKLHYKPQSRFLQLLQKEFQYGIDLIYVNYQADLFNIKQEDKNKQVFDMSQQYLQNETKNSRKSIEKTLSEAELLQQALEKSQLESIKCFYQVSKDVSEIEQLNLSPRERSNYNTDIYEGQLELLKTEYERLLKDKKTKLEQSIDYQLYNLKDKYLESIQKGEEIQQQNIDEPIPIAPISSQYDKYMKKNQKSQLNEDHFTENNPDWLSRCGALYDNILAEHRTGDTELAAQKKLQESLQAVCNKLIHLKENDLDGQIAKNQAEIARLQTETKRSIIENIDFHAVNNARQMHKQAVAEVAARELKLQRHSVLEEIMRRHGVYNTSIAKEQQSNLQTTRFINCSRRPDLVMSPGSSARYLAAAGFGARSPLRKSTIDPDEFQNFDYINYSRFHQIRVIINKKQFLIFTSEATGRLLETLSEKDIYMLENYNEKVPENLLEEEQTLQDLGIKKYYENYGLICMWKSDQRLLIVSKTESKYVIYRLKQKLSNQTAATSMKRQTKVPTTMKSRR